MLTKYNAKKKETIKAHGRRWNVMEEVENQSNFMLPIFGGNLWWLFWQIHSPILSLPDPLPPWHTPSLPYCHSHPPVDISTILKSTSILGNPSPWEPHFCKPCTEYGRCRNHCSHCDRVYCDLAISLGSHKLSGLYPGNLLKPYPAEVEYCMYEQNGWFTSVWLPWLQSS